MAQTKKGSNSRQAPKKPSGQAPKKPSGQNTRKPSGQNTRKPSGQAPKKPSGQTTKKPSGQTTKKPSGQITKKPSGQITNLSQYAKIYAVDLGVGPLAIFHGKPIHTGKSPGTSVSINVNGKPVNAVSISQNGIVAYIQNGQVVVSQMNSEGKYTVLPTSKRRSIMDAIQEVGISGITAVAQFLYGQSKDPKIRDQINNTILAPVKGIGVMNKNDVSSLGLKPKQTYNYQGKQYTIYQNGDSYKVGVMPCKGKCTDNVKGQQAMALYTAATPWATVGNAPSPGITKDDMKPGTVYTTKDGKNYQVNSDGKSFSQCTSSGGSGGQELRALGYRGIMSGISNLCRGRGRPANDMIANAIQNSQVSSPMTSAQNYLQQYPQATYGQYSIAVASSGNRLSEAEFNRLRGQMNLPPSYQGQEPPTQHQSVINSVTQTYVQRNPNASYEAYKKKYGNNAVSREEYNAMREQNGLPPVYQTLGSEPMTYSQLQSNAYPINSFVEPLYSRLYGNNSGNISISTQNSLENIQSWLQHNPPPLQQGQGIRQWMQNFLTNNQSSLGNLGNSGMERNNANLATMIANYISTNVGNRDGTYWNDNNLNNVSAQLNQIYNNLYGDATHTNLSLLSLL